MTGRHAVRSGTHSVPIGALAGRGLVAWEKTIGELLSDTGYRCAVYGKWHVGEGPGRWPTDKGFEEWYGPPRTYDEALWPSDPFYDPQRDPVSRMVEIKWGDSDVTELDQLTLDVRRDCDLEYLHRAETFIRDAAAADTPFYVYFNHSLMHMPVLPASSSRARPARGTGPTVCSSSTPISERCWISSPSLRSPGTRSSCCAQPECHCRLIA